VRDEPSILRPHLCVRPRVVISHRPNPVRDEPFILRPHLCVHPRVVISHRPNPVRDEPSVLWPHLGTSGQEGQGDQNGCARQEEPIPHELLRAQKDSDKDTHDVT
jgi:hypothetical protein